MGNTSDRVSGDRHGTKSHRADGGSSHKEQEPSKIMVDSTDDPNIFNTHTTESKVLRTCMVVLCLVWAASVLSESFIMDPPKRQSPYQSLHYHPRTGTEPSGEKEFTPFAQDLEDSVRQGPQARPTVIRWAGGGKEVYIAGSFNNWSTKIPLNKSHNDFVAILDLPEGEHQYKFFVDGQWMHDPSEPVVTSQLGTINNLIHVKKSDFEVFDALQVDSLECSDTSDLSSSPPGPYGQEVYVFLPEERFKAPPILPPHLLQVILNKDTNISCDPALLPEPNHVMLNHLYALSIKDGVMVLSATHRYKKKYVTSLLYKPI